MNPAVWTRLFAFGVWLLALCAMSTAALLFAASRVGEGAETTYGSARTAFEASWGGAIDQSMPTFAIRKRWMAPQGEGGVTILRERTEDLPIVPRETALDMELTHGEHRQGWLSFQAFTLQAHRQPGRRSARVRLSLGGGRRAARQPAARRRDVARSHPRAR